ncbi:MAG: type I 3-dehydroquinate dehydratase [Clostridiaceae bacterium]
MSKVVEIKNVAIGEGTPKICVPIVGRKISDIIEEASYLKGLDFDIVEWRVDFYEEVANILKVKEALQSIRDILQDKPIIFTFRSKKEGGETEISNQYYFELNKAIAETRLADSIDIELFNEESDVRGLVEIAHTNDLKVIMSNHDFYKTPEKEEIISRLRKMEELGADIPKIAVMPTSTEDVITLLDATRIMKEQYAKGPIITMAMAGKGVISRLSGELFGSALTFGAAKKVSAPGQISVEDLRKTLEILHKNL